MESAENLRTLQRKREKYLRDSDYDLFSEAIVNKNPLLGDVEKDSSSVWEKELGPFYAEVMKNIPKMIKNEIDVKFKQLGSELVESSQKEAYKSIMLEYIRFGVRSLVFISLKTVLDACLQKDEEEDDVSCQYVVGKIALEIFRKIKPLLQNKKINKKKKHFVKINPGVVVDVSFEDIKRDLFHIASYFLDVIVLNQEVIVRVERKHRRDVHRLAFGSKIADYYDPEKAKSRLFNPTNHPMICEPDDWDCRLKGGGYLLKEDDFLLNVKSAKHKKCILGEMKLRGSKDVFLEALNLLQKTSWKLNERLLYFVKYFHDNELCGNDLAKRMLCDQTMNLAKDLGKGAFYIPWYLDFRGRMYSSVIQISPQSHDEGRSLLSFAEPMMITKDNENHSFEKLAIFGYSKYSPDFGKASKNRMVSWIESNQRDIMKCAEDPIKNFEFWQKASDKYSFLAFCLEWSDIKKSKNGHRYTRLSIYVDGTCNGFQHYAALLRDEVSAPLVNLVDSDAPGDFYQNVVERLLGFVSAKDFTDPTVKRLVLEFVDRSFIKKSIISAGYGAGVGSRCLVTFKNLRDALRERYGDDVPSDLNFPSDKKIKTEDNDLYKKSEIIEKQINDAIKELCPSFAQVKQWLTNVIKTFNKTNEIVSWKNPAGVPVFNLYYHFPEYTINLFMNGKPHKFQFRNFDATNNLFIKKKKTASGISPNYIHSLDAGHAAKIIVEFVKSMGKDDRHWIASVHDSFACHAPYVDNLQKIIRNTFYEMHSENQLEIFKAQVEDKYKVSLPELPKFGTLDLKNVLQSKYFFY